MGRSKLTDAQISEIRAAYAQGCVTQAELGRRYGVRQDTISYNLDHATRERCRARKAPDPEYARAYYKANRGRVLERKAARADPERDREYQAAWRRANPEIVRAIAQRRRARKLAAPGQGWPAEILEVLRVEAYRNRCIYCRETTAKLTLEHVTPLSRGGSHEPSNLVLACKRCNSSKGARLISEWRPELAWVEGFARFAGSPEQLAELEAELDLREGTRRTRINPPICSALAVRASPAPAG